TSAGSIQLSGFSREKQSVVIAAVEWSGVEVGGGGGGSGGCMECGDLQPPQHSFTSDGGPRCWRSRAELRARGTHCYGNITESVFRLC
ncbi:Hypothetical predicted protein, partial [Xyrichtys novacula]